MGAARASIAFGAVSIIAFSVVAKAEDAKKIVYATTTSAIHPVSTKGLEPYFKKVEQDAGGSLKFEIFPGGALASGKTSLKALGSGTIDMSLLADIYSPTDLPVSTSLSDLAVWGKDARVMTGAVNQMLAVDSMELQDDYRKNNVIAFASYSLTPYYFICNKTEVKAPDNVKGIKVRGTGSMGQLVAALGGTPVNITSAEIYEAIQRGQANCTLGPVPWLKTYTLWDVANVVSDEAVGTYHGTNIVNMNIDKWKKLSDKERAAMLKYLPSIVRSMAEAYEEDDVSVKAEAISKGVKFVKSEPSLDEAISKFRANEVTRVAELARKRGVKDPEKLSAKFRAAIDKWTKIVADIGAGTWGKEQWDKYEATLKSEIYDKARNFDLKS